MADVINLVAQASGFDATGKSIEEINKKVKELLEPIAAISKIDLAAGLNKKTGDFSRTIGKLRGQIELLDKDNNKFIVSLVRQGSKGDVYKLIATEVKKTTDVIRDKDKALKESAKIAEQTFNQELNAAKKWREGLDALSKRKARQSDITDINNQLGGFKGSFTSSGLLSIDRANKNLLDVLSKSNISTGRLNTIFGATKNNDRKILDSLTSDEQKASIALRRLASAFDQASNAGLRTQNILIGFRGMLRLLEVQQLHSVISNISSYFEQSGQKAIELTGHIAEIQTISQKAQQTTDQWRNSLIQLSNAYGLDVIDVAKAGYEAISNQIAKGAAITPFLAQSFEFARATASSAAESVDLLSSALNGYGLGAEHTQKVAAILFKTIELGRVRANELAQTLGNSTPIANALGISLEELGAGIATLTIQGVKPHTALTLMNNIMLKLLKPTKDMKELLDEWGVASGQAAIQAFGFGGVLAKLDKEFQAGGLGRVAELAGDMRAIRAEAGLLAGGSFDKFNDSLKQMTEGQDEYRKSVELTANSMQTKLAKEFEKLNNIFIGEIGIRKNEILLSFIEGIGGLDKAVQGIANATITMVKIVSDLSVHLVNLNTLFDQSGLGISRLAPLLIGGGTSYLIMNKSVDLLAGSLGIFNSILGNSNSALHPAATNLAIVSERMHLLSRNASSSNLEFTKLSSSIGRFATVAIPLAIAAYSYYSAAQEEFQRDLMNAGNDFLNSTARFDIEYSKKVQDASNKISTELTKGLKDASKELSLFHSVFQSRLNSLGKESLNSSSRFAMEHFEEGLIGKNAIQKLNLISEKFNEMSVDVSNLFDAKNFEGAEKAIEKIIGLTKQFKDEQRKVLEEVKKVTDKLRESSEDKAFEYKYFSKSDRKKTKVYGARSEELKEEALTSFNSGDLDKADKLIERAILIREKSMSFSESIVSSQGFGRPKGLKEFQDLIDLRIKIQETLGQKASMSDRGNVMYKWAEDMHGVISSNIKSADNLKTKIQEVKSTLEELIVTIDKANSKLAGDRTSLMSSIREFSGTGIEGFVSRTNPFYKQSQHYVDLQVLSYAKENINLNSLIASYERLNTAKIDLQKSFAEGSNDSDDTILKKFELVKKRLEETVKLQEKIRNLAISANEDRFFDLDIFTKKETGLGAGRKTAQEVLNNTLKAANAIDTSRRDLLDQRSVVEKLRDEEKTARLELTATKDQMADLFKNKLPETFKAATEAIKSAEDPLKAIQERLREALKGVREEVERILPKLRDTAPALPGNALGGLIMGGGYAGGGLINGPLGRDNLLIRAHGGEFMMNAEATQMFYPQLVAMNSMYQSSPGYNNGGPITQVGDIHINANLTGETNIDVVALGKQLRREIKRGTVRLN